MLFLFRCFPSGCRHAHIFVAFCFFSSRFPSRNLGNDLMHWVHGVRRSCCLSSSPSGYIAHGLGNLRLERGGTFFGGDDDDDDDDNAAFAKKDAHSDVIFSAGGSQSKMGITVK